MPSVSPVTHAENQLLGSRSCLSHGCLFKLHIRGEHPDFLKGARIQHQFGKGYPYVNSVPLGPGDSTPRDWGEESYATLTCLGLSGTNRLRGRDAP